MQPVDGVAAQEERANIGRVIFQFGDYELDEEAGELRRGGARVELQPKPFELLRTLLRERARIVSNDELMNALWPDTAVTPSSLTRAVSLARRAIGDAHHGERIRSEARRGYRFVADVRELSVRAPAARGSEAIADARATPFVGREDALRELRSALEAARAGSARIAVLTGRAGIGKTRLAEAFAHECRVGGVRVIEARCRDREGAPAFWMWREVLRQIASEAPDSPAVKELIRRRDGLGLDGGAPSSAHSPEQSRFLFFDAAAKLLRDTAEKKPLLIVLEDLQWAAKESLDLLEHVAFELPRASLLLLATVRDAGVSRARPIERTLAMLRPLDRILPIELRAFSRREVGDLLAREIGRAAPPDLTSEIAARTEGVPLYLRELLRELRASGDLAEPERLAARPVPIPEKSLQLLRRSLGALSERGIALLEAGAVLGREFPLVLAADVAGLSREDATEALDVAVARGVIEVTPGPRGAVRFAHALYREAVYEGIAPGKRTRLHLRAADRIEQRAAPDLASVASELSYHHAEALAVGDAERALGFAERAGDQARARLAWDEAATHYERAVAAADLLIPSDAARKLALLVRLGEAHALARDPQRRRAALRDASALALSLGKDAELVQAAITYCDLSEWSPADPDAEGLLRTALARAGEKDARARLTTRLAYRQVRVDGALAAETARTALAMARKTKEPLLIQEAAYVLSFALAGPDHLAERAALRAEIERTMAACAQRETGLIALLDLACDQLMLGDASAARELRRSAGALAGNAPHAGIRWHLLAYDAGLASLECRLDDSAQLALEAHAAGQRARHPFAQGVYDIQLVAVACDHGDPSAALDRFAPLTSRESANWGLPLHWLMATVGRARLYSNDRPAAEAMFRRLAEPGFSAVPRNIRWTRSLGEIAHLCADLEAKDAAEELIALIEPRAEQHACVPIPVAYAGPLRHALGRLYELSGKRDAAIDTYALALEDAERVGARGWRARVLLDAARLDRDVKRGRKRAEEARAEAVALALGGLAKRAAEELARRGA
jgi:DNA-binding winged helix-turn-helix (wHTH) protein